MAKSLTSLIIGALDDFAHVQELQILLRIGLNEAENPSEEACEKLVLLVETYLCQSEPWLTEVQFGLDRIGQQIGLPEEEE